ncbi:MAG TPA: Mur ligase family protein [Verrucomicrobiae bacterium]|nr:Mur ligase family protein [Verrucomicrobiae bacterium]
MRAIVRQFVLSVMWGAVKRRFKAENPYVIAVTGSVGKTSTKEAIATMLEAAGKPVVKTIANLATDTGIPLSLLGFGEKVRGGSAWIKVIIRSLTAMFPAPAAKPYWVLEYSSDKPGDLAFLGKRVPVDVVVVTSGGPVHMEYYKTQEAVVAELADLLNYRRSGGYVVINGDDPFLKEATWPEETVTFGVAGLTKNQAKVDIRGKVTNLTPKGMSCEFSSDTKVSAESLIRNTQGVLEATVAVVGKQQLAPLVAAVAIGAKEGLMPNDLKKGVEAYQVPAGRGRLIAGIKDVTIVDDSANASPEAAVAGVAMLRPWAQGRRTVAILGTMNEMGEVAVEAHQEVAAAAAKSVDFFVALGQFADEMVDAAKKAGMPGHHVLGFDTPEKLFTHLDQIVERNDIIYVKASQNGMRLERLVKRLMAKPDTAAELLVRQSNAWKE